MLSDIIRGELFSSRLKLSNKTKLKDATCSKTNYDAKKQRCE